MLVAGSGVARFSVSLAVACAWLGVVSTPVEAARSPRTGSITVRVTALPAGMRGTVRLSGPRGGRRLARTGTIHSLPGGAYTLTARPVNTSTRTYYPTVASCAALARCPALPHGRATLRRGGHLTLYVVYENVVSRKAELLQGPALAEIVSHLRTGGELAFQGPVPPTVKTNAVLVAPPTTSLPSGLFRKVTGITKRGAETAVSTEPASLTEVSPRGAFDVTTSQVSAATSRTDARSTSVTSVGLLDLAVNDNTSCQASSGVGDFTGGIDFSEPQFHIVSEWNPSTQTPILGISGTMSVTASVGATLSGTVGCKFNVNLPRESVGKVLGRIPTPTPFVWILPELVGVINAEINTSGTFDLNLQETLGATAAITYDNGPHFTVSPFSSATSTVASPGNSGTATVQFGGKVYFDFDGLRDFACAFATCNQAPPTPAVSATAGPILESNRAPVEPWWRLDLGGALSVELESKYLHIPDISHDFDFTLKALLAPPGTPKNVKGDRGMNAPRSRGPRRNPIPRNLRRRPKPHAPAAR